jgi:hypothetical protein
LVGILINNLDVGSELLSDLFGVLLRSCLEQFGDIDILRPFLFVLFALQTFDFDELCHFNFGK